MNYNEDFAQYYDKIFSRKNYSQEVECVLELYKKHADHRSDLESVLDFGCGTGTHLFYLNEKLNNTASMVGYDCSEEMIMLANNKTQGVDNCFFTNNKDDITDKFDLAISMFYVVNHLVTLEELKGFLEFTSSKLKKNGLLIFDCWNGITAIKDPPYSAERERYSDHGEKIVTACISNTDLINSHVHMKNVVKIINNNNVLHTFNYELKHTLWTPFLLKQLLKEYNFDIISVNKAYDIKKEAGEKDYKIVFTCRYSGDGGTN
tara:strand:- start:887 stop:1672 length:786 start_codon:yes stop_codon:yes gene_type:complete